MTGPPFAFALKTALILRSRTPTLRVVYEFRIQWYFRRGYQRGHSDVLSLVLGAESYLCAYNAGCLSCALWYISIHACLLAHAELEHPQGSVGRSQGSRCPRCFWSCFDEMCRPELRWCYHVMPCICTNKSGVHGLVSGERINRSGMNDMLAFVSTLIKCCVFIALWAFSKCQHIFIIRLLLCILSNLANNGHLWNQRDYKGYVRGLNICHLEYNMYSKTFIVWSAFYLVGVSFWRWWCSFTEDTFIRENYSVWWICEELKKTLMDLHFTAA